MESLWIAPYFSQHWKHAWLNLGRNFLFHLGYIWLLARVASVSWPSASESWCVVVLPLLFAMWSNYRSTSSVKHRLKDTDVWIEIKIGDLFKKVSGSLVVSANSTFDTSVSGGIISADSVQGQFTNKYYDNEAHLDRDLETALEGEKFDSIEDGRNGKKKRYAIGTVAKIQPKEQTVYMVAIADMNENGIATGSPDGLIRSLGKLWHYIAEHGEIKPVTVPVLGTGSARINIKREDMVKEIVRSFIAACSEKRFCDRLAIIISKKDYLQQEMDLQMLGSHLQYLCQDTSLKGKGDTGGGRAV